MHRTAWIFGLASIAIVTSTRTAHALGPIDLEVGAKAGVGTKPYNGDGPNPLGFGLGGRAGVVLLDHLYGGVNVMYYLGDSQNGVSFNTLMYGVEAGWGLKLLEILTIRPQVGLGNATFSAGNASNSNLYVEPGVTGLVSLGMLFVGADANVLVFPGLANSNAAFTLHGQVGLKF
ncbi:MAG TPA: hypothetical protein VMI75_16705 [Polyangiaceae bacterium]|nr:hypothetical protein [Polyangiaceae bacterium]